MSKELGQESAFPFQTEYQESKLIIGSNGMSKRFYAACAAMQGLICANPHGAKEMTMDDIDIITSQSFQFADELLKRESNEQE